MIHNMNQEVAHLAPQADSQLNDVYSGVITQLESRARGEKLNGLLLGLTSSSAGEGVSTIIQNLGDFCCETLQRRTLLIDLSPISDGDSLSPDGTPTLQPPGLWDVVADNLNVDDLAEGNHLSRLVCLGAGNMSPSVTFEAVNAKLDELRSSYDVILIDLPPNTHANRIAVEEMLDSVILVVQAGATNKQQFSSIVEQLEHRNVKLTGVVLNRVENEMPSLNSLPGDVIDMGFACIWFLKTLLLSTLKAIPWTVRKVIEAWRRQR